MDQTRNVGENRNWKSFGLVKIGHPANAAWIMNVYEHFSKRMNTMPGNTSIVITMCTKRCAYYFVYSLINYFCIILSTVPLISLKINPLPLFEEISIDDCLNKTFATGAIASNNELNNYTFYTFTVLAVCPHISCDGVHFISLARFGLRYSW